MDFRLHKTLFFNVSSAAFILLAVPATSIILRGLVGFFILTIMSIIAGLFERSAGKIAFNIKKGINVNFLFFGFSIWYAVGLIVNVLLGGGGLDDWRLMMGPVVFLIALFYSFAFMHDDECYRRFQIAFIIFWGIQAIFTFKIIHLDNSIVRQTVSTGIWLYGEQGGFAMIAMVLPMMLWRSLNENGAVKFFLLSFCGLLIITISISSFATPLGMLFVSVLLILLLLTVFPVTRGGRFTAVILSLIIGSTTVLVYTFTHDNPLLAAAYYRLENFLDDPTSGGYSGLDLDGSRWYLAEISLRSFLEEPFFGMGGGSIRASKFVGGHSSLLDSLGGYGLLGGGGAFCGMILFLFVASFYRFRRERKWETLLGVVSCMLLFLGGIINPYWEGIQPFCVLLMTRPFLRNGTAGRYISNGPNFRG